MTEQDPERPVSTGARPSPLDDIDRRIVDALRADGRLSVRALAEQVHVSRAAVHARVQRLERDGVLLGYQARVDPDRLGLSVSALVHLRIAQQTWKEVRERICAIPEVWHATLVSGEYDLVLLVRTSDAAALRDLVLNRLQAIPSVRATHTILILDEVGDAPAGRTVGTGP
ncbi:Lrp/AsnC family transcriptional regulator [Geodermatophilus ruber]|uniref:Transcriptional regulator, AsnC family n=1 Tax=Geodermatophilus ruber TaxID=504800 RepID=A0A1I4GJH6_9ACTN|nr:Lrp/AsnC family transcriptional regulator [Geodermatophilus ruber]SFL30178.1 transcriptional regulator, AsnC family [Geodermatophilus ruber]